MASTPHSSTDFPSGWILFTATTLFLSGGMTVLFGLALLLNDSVVAVGGSGGPVILDTTAWGWVLLAGGIIMGLTGIALALQVGVARWTAGAFVTLHAIGMFAVATEFPLLAIVVIGLDVIILYELTVRW